MTVALPQSLTANRLLEALNAEEPAARAEGRWWQLVLAGQRLSCADRADGIFLLHAHDLPAIRRREPVAVATLEAAIAEHLVILAANAATLAEAEGLAPEQLSQMVEAAHHGFRGRLGVLLVNASEAQIA